MLGALLCAYASKDRVPATLCAVGLSVSWVITVTSWWPYSVANMLWSIGIDAKSVDVWAACNMLNGMLAAWSGRHLLWQPILTGMLLAALANDLVFWATKEWGPYSTTADALFICECALFYAIGAKGLWEKINAASDAYLTRIVHVFRGMGLLGKAVKLTRLL